MMRGDVVGGKYRLTRQIGEGAMGTVWAAVHEAISRDVAIKLIRRPDEELRRRLLREARACGQLRHRNIIEVHDLGTTDEGDPFLVMPLLHGETLADLLKRTRKLDARTTASIGRDVARALSAAHAAGVIHRDLKPANIFLHREDGAEEAVVKVLDFGVSKNLIASDGTCTVTGGLIGSLAYMSPEQAQASRDVDHRADIWALGVVLFEMLTGNRPIQGDSNNILYRICDPEVEIPRVSRYLWNFNPDFEKLIARCLSRDLSRRIDCASEVAEALKGFTQASYSPPASPPSPRSSAPGADAVSTRGAGLDTGYSLAIAESVTAAMSVLPSAAQAPRVEVQAGPKPSVPSAPPASMAPASAVSAEPRPGSAPHLPTLPNAPISPRVHVDRPRAPVFNAPPMAAPTAPSPASFAQVALDGKTIPLIQYMSALPTAPSNVGVTTSIASSVTRQLIGGSSGSPPSSSGARSHRATGIAVSVLASGVLVACLGGGLYYGLYRSRDAGAETKQAAQPSGSESAPDPKVPMPLVNVPAPPITKPQAPAPQTTSDKAPNDKAPNDKAPVQRAAPNDKAPPPATTHPATNPGTTTNGAPKTSPSSTQGPLPPPPPKKPPAGASDPFKLFDGATVPATPKRKR